MRPTGKPGYPGGLQSGTSANCKITLPFDVPLQLSLQKARQLLDGSNLPPDARMVDRQGIFEASGQVGDSGSVGVVDGRRKRNNSRPHEKIPEYPVRGSYSSTILQLHH